MHRFDVFPILRTWNQLIFLFVYGKGLSWTVVAAKMNNDRQPKDYARHWPNISSSAFRAAKKSASSSSDGASTSANPLVAAKKSASSSSDGTSTSTNPPVVSASSSSDGASTSANPPVAKKQVKPRAAPEHNYYPILSVNPTLAVNDAESWNTSLAWLECIEKW
jgi:flagellar hook-length control protein FliK